ncbi:MAG: alpha-L-rhamnosidase [Bacteroidales bacterium]|nr:alpha-L-rhamnosidase [Bacteroidales bacterium]
MKKDTLCLIAALCSMIAGTFPAKAQNPQQTQKKESEFVEEYLTPIRVMKTEGYVIDSEKLMVPYVGQVSTDEPDVSVFKTTKDGKASVLLDFGKEIQGGVQIVRSISDDHSAAVFHLCFGESVSEAMSDVNAEESTATNDHSVRDFETAVPWLGTAVVGETGFRFLRIDLVSKDVEVPVRAIRAVSRYRDIPWLGTFKCDDERINKIWETGAYTVHLNMQDYLWDGIKRDRLVWIGDMHPEVMTVGTVFGNHDVVRKSLDYVRDGTPADSWMNGICSYSLWWIIIHHHLYWYYGDKEYLSAQKDYLTALLRNVMKNVDGNKENYQEGRFIDWPTNDNPDAIHAGLQALTVRALEAGSELAGWLSEPALSQECKDVAARLRTYVPDHKGNKEAAALLAIQGMIDGKTAKDVIVKDGAKDFTSFMGYYMLEALAKSGDYADAINLISEYWGKMLDLGATTFWEDFNYEDSKNAARIDEFVPEGKFDIHADGGAYCYVGLRHSFCHGWASGPTAWLSQYILGVEPAEPGFRKVRIKPHLGNLKWVEGSFPTPYGVIHVTHSRRPDGQISSKVELPEGVESSAE